MLAFYWTILKDFPAVLRSTTEAYLFWVLSIILPCMVLLWPASGPMSETTEFSRLFVLVPIALSVAYGMLRVTYARFKELERDRAKEVADLRVQLDSLSSELRDNIASLPKLAVGSCGVEPIPAYPQDIQRLERLGLTGGSYVYVSICNDPSVRSDRSVALALASTVAMVDDRGASRAEIQSRWLNGRPHSFPPQGQKTTQLAPNNLPEFLVVAVLTADGRGFLYGGGHIMSLDECQAMPPGAATVRVSLRGIGVDRFVRDFQITTAATQASVSLVASDAGQRTPPPGG